MGELLVGPVLVTSLLAGVVALLAPCCVSVMLPAYLSTVFHRPASVMAGTLVFAAGVPLDGRPYAFGRLSERALRRAFAETTASVLTSRSGTVEMMITDGRARGLHSAGFPAGCAPSTTHMINHLSLMDAQE